MQTFGEHNSVNEMADVVRDATEEIEALQQDIAMLIAAAEQAMWSLMELDGGDPTSETGWNDAMALQAWRALRFAIAISSAKISGDNANDQQP